MIAFLRRIAKGRGRKGPRPVSQGAGKADSDRIELAGDAFRKMGPSTLEHDWHFVALLRELELLEPYRLEEEPAADYGRRLLVDLISSGRAAEILAHLILPADLGDEDWTPEVAAQTAKRIGALTAQEDKEKVHALTLGFLLDFFAHGLNSWPNSMIYSAPETTGTNGTISPTTESTAPPTATGAGQR